MTFSLTNNVRLYGAQQNGKSFDVFARCAISACMPGPGDDVTAVMILDQARLLWRSVSFRDKSEWDCLFAVRHTDPNVFKRGHGLLETQGLLARLRYVIASHPDTRLSLPQSGSSQLGSRSQITARHTSSTKSISPISFPVLLQTRTD